MASSARRRYWSLFSFGVSPVHLTKLLIPNVCEVATSRSVRQGFKSLTRTASGRFALGAEQVHAGILSSATGQGSNFTSTWSDYVADSHSLERGHLPCTSFPLLSTRSRRACCCCFHTFEIHRRMSKAPSSPLRVPDLVQKHEQAIRDRSPSSSPTHSRTLNTLSPPTAPTSPSPASKTLPNMDSLKVDQPAASTVEAGNPSTTSSSRGASPSGSMSNSLVLEDIKEGEPLKVEQSKDEDDSSDDEVDDAGMTESQLFPAKDKKEDAAATPAAEAKEGDEASKDDDKDDKPAAPAGPEVSALDQLRELVDKLPAAEQEIVRKNLENIKEYPEALPLSAPWSESRLPNYL